MSTLEGSKVSETYKDLLQISNNNQGIDTTIRYIEDGEGTPSVLGLSDTHVSIDGNVGIGTTDPNSSLHVKSAGIGTVIMLESDDDGSAYAPDLVLFRNSETPAVNDNIGEIKFRGRNDNETSVDYTMIRSRIVNPANGAENGELTFWTNKNNALEQRMTIDSDGNVGIGTTSPDRLLHVSGGSSSVLAGKFETASTTGSMIVFKDADTTTNDLQVRIGSDANDLVQYAGGSERMRIDSDGNVGIGTTVPNGDLHVNDGDSACQIYITSKDTSTAGLYLGDQTRGFRGGVLYNNSTDSLGLWGYDDTSQTAQRMTIDSDGNVGIGTTSPDEMLHISGTSPNIKLTDTNTNLSSLLYADTGTGSLLLVADSTGEGTDPFISFRTQSTSVANERLRITNNGNVGIGTTSPAANHKLHIKNTETANFRLERNKAAHTNTQNGYVQIAAAEGSNLIYSKDLDGNDKDFVIDAGNVGIGTTSPDKRLEVALTDDTAYGEGGTGRGIRVKNESESASSYTSLELIGGLAGASSIARIHAIQDNTTNASTSLAFTLRTSSNGTKECMRIDSAGNVGIGTSGPQMPLHVESGKTLTYSPTSVGANSNRLTRFRLKNNSQVDGQTASLGLISSGNNGTSNAEVALNCIQETDTSTSSIFTIQQRKSDQNYHETFRIASNGNVAIGTTNPAGFKLNVQSDANTVPIKGYRATGTATSYLLALNSNIGTGSDVTKFRVEADGDVISATNSYTSDERAKSEISDLNYGLDTIKQLQPKQFKMRYSEEKGFKYGFIAQEVETILPDLIRNDGIEDGEGGSYKALEYNSIIAILTKAIQELKSEIDSLKSQLNPDNSSSTQEPVVEEASEEPVAEEAPVQESQLEEVAQVSLGQVSLGQDPLDQVSDSRAET